CSLTTRSPSSLIRRGWGLISARLGIAGLQRCSFPVESRSCHIKLRVRVRCEMRTCTLLPLILLAASGFSVGQPAPSPTAQDDLARIVGYSMLSGGASNFLEVLTDKIGGRITGSPESGATADLILQALKDAGFANAHFEPYEINPGWQHGPCTAEVVSTVSRGIYVGSYGWAPG